MSAWFLLVGFLVCSWLAFDAWQLARNDKNIHAALALKGLGETDARNLAQIQDNARRVVGNPLRYGMGDPEGAVWLWGILALACLGGAVSVFFY